MMGVLLPGKIYAAVPPNQYIYVEGDVGIQSPTDGAQGLQVAWSEGVGFRLGSEVAFGLFLIHSTQNITVMNVQSNSTNYIFGPQFIYYFDIPELYGFGLGIKTGLYYRTLSSSATILGLPIQENNNTLIYVLGPRISYEYTFDFGLAVGVEANLFYGFSSPAVLPIHVLGTVKVWF